MRNRIHTAFLLALFCVPLGALAAAQEKTSELILLEINEIADEITNINAGTPELMALAEDIAEWTRRAKAGDGDARAQYFYAKAMEHQIRAEQVKTLIPLYGKLIALIGKAKASERRRVGGLARRDQKIALGLGAESIDGLRPGPDKDLLIKLLVRKGRQLGIGMSDGDVQSRSTVQILGAFEAKAEAIYLGLTLTEGDLALNKVALYSLSLGALLDGKDLRELPDISLDPDVVAEPGAEEVVEIDVDDRVLINQIIREGRELRANSPRTR